MPAPERDFYLASWLDTMETLNFSADITLTVGGLLISGQPIGEEEYFKELGEQFDEGFRKLGAEETEFRERLPEQAVNRKALKEIATQELTKLAGAIPEGELASAEQFDRLRELTRTYVNLKNVVVFGASPQPISIPLWRGRLAEVAGWNLGRLGT